MMDEMLCCVDSDEFSYWAISYTAYSAFLFVYLCVYVLFNYYFQFVYIDVCVCVCTLSHVLMHSVGFRITSCVGSLLSAATSTHIRLSIPAKHFRQSGDRVEHPQNTQNGKPNQTNLSSRKNLVNVEGRDRRRI